MHRTLFVAAFFFLLIPAAHAAPIGDTSGQVQPLSVSILPIYPRPYDTISITLQTTLLNLPASTVTITANDVVILKGNGTETAHFTLGGPGTKTKIHISLESEGKNYVEDLIISPADVALIEEAQSDTHPFYEGGALPSATGKIRIIAVPDFRTASNARIPADKLSYTWKVGDRILDAESGFGRSVFLANAPVRYRNATVEVTVTNPDESINGHAVITVAPTDPIALIYRNDPLLGPDFTTAISDIFSMKTTEETFRVVPYYFAHNPSITWTLNSNPAGTDRSVTVRTTSTSAGSAVLGVSANDAATSQAANQTFTINFLAAKSKSIFGF